MVSRRRLFLALVLNLFLIACEATVRARDISSVPASSSQFRIAQTAVSICGQNFPGLESTASNLRAAGFQETQNPRFTGISSLQRFIIFEHPDASILVGLANRGQRVCLVGLEGMTPNQSFSLAQAWVKRYGATTNAENGQGLSSQVVQAWQSANLDRTVFIAALKSFPFFEKPGAAVRLTHF